MWKNQSIALNSSNDQYTLFFINLIDLLININSWIMKSMRNDDAFNSNVYYIYDFFSEVHPVKISWINEIEKENS